MALDLCNTVIDILKQNPEQHFTARELAEKVATLKPTDCQAKMERSKATITPINTREALIGQLVAEIGAHKNKFLEKSDSIKMTADRPRKYYYSTKTDEQEIIEAEKPTRKNEQPEHALYPLLCQYLQIDELKIFPKRIDEKKSSNLKGKNGNKWLHPDIVGVQNLSKDWCGEVINCANKQAFNKTSLWSFEVKLVINRSNVRESFFQTVSNSSWANYSYLVAPEIDERVKSELQILCGGHQIGLIQLNKDNPPESDILIPAPKKQTLDWAMIDRIAKENPDFKEFINLITEFYQTGKLKERDWDIPNG